MKYIIPFFYTHKYNRKGIEGWVYFFEYYIALLLLLFFYTSNEIELLLFILGLTAYMLVYEIGYIENNVLAIQKEKKPTLRHNKSELYFIEKYFQKISFFRYFLSILLVYIISLNTNVLVFVVLLIVTRVVFFLYNMKYRDGFLNRLLFVVLRFVRYFSPVWFLGIYSAVFATVVVIVNMINNFAWYDRWGFQLPRFFGTKLFDSAIYFGVYIYFAYGSEVDKLSYIFLYMAVIKILLFMIVFMKKGLKDEA